MRMIIEDRHITIGDYQCVAQCGGYWTVSAYGRLIEEGLNKQQVRDLITLAPYPMVGLNSDWYSTTHAVGNYFISLDEPSGEYLVITRVNDYDEGVTHDTELLSGTALECLNYCKAN